MGKGETREEGEYQRRLETRWKRASGYENEQIKRKTKLDQRSGLGERSLIERQKQVLPPGGCTSGEVAHNVRVASSVAHTEYKLQATTRRKKGQGRGQLRGSPAIGLLKRTAEG